MADLRSLLIEELQDLLHAEKQLVAALPQMAEAAHLPRLKETFEVHLGQTQDQVARLQKAFQLLGESAEPKLCLAMRSLIEGGREKINEGSEKDELSADLSLISAAQKIKHYEIAGYGTARILAFHLGEREVGTLLSHTLGEEESSDYLLAIVAKPLLQDAETVEQPAKSQRLSKAARPGQLVHA
jgi:Mn-containing catalase